MTLHLVQLRLEPRWLVAWASAAGVPTDDEGYLVHAALRAAFGALGPQPFRVLSGDPGRPIKVLGYAAGGEAAFHEALETPREPILAKVFADAVHAKPMPISWRAGRTLAFDLRLCPVARRRRREPGGGRAKGHDEFDLFLRHVEEVPDDQPLHREAVYKGWLADQLARGGAVLEAAALTRFEQPAPVRRAHPAPAALLLGRRPRTAARRPDATFEGRLRVEDPDRFSDLLGRGLGRHRAFGFGMLLLRPA